MAKALNVNSIESEKFISVIIHNDNKENYNEKKHIKEDTIIDSLIFVKKELVKQISNSSELLRSISEEIIKNVENEPNKTVINNNISKKNLEYWDVESQKFQKE
jgi:hypothetical protein